MKMEEIVVSIAEVKRFIVDCMLKIGTDEQHASQLADILAEADYRGHYSHGMNRINYYVDDVRSKKCNATGEPKILQESPGTIHVDGNNLLGPVVGNFCMEKAIEKAKQNGIGMVVARNSNHFGIVGWYTMQALKEGLIGMAFTNASQTVAPTRAKKALIGTNPLSFAAPAQKDSFVLDMANSTVALGKVEIQQCKGQPIPKGWGIDKEGKLTTDPSKLFDGGALLPLGGEESTSGYKGYGLSMMVEILCGVLAGASYGMNIKGWGNLKEAANLAQTFIAINPKCFAPDFEENLSEMLGAYRNVEPSDTSKPVLIPGDPEKIHMKLCDNLGGIPYHHTQLGVVCDFAKKMGVEPPKKNL